MSTSSGPDLSPHFDPTSVERDIYARWVECGVFTGHPERSARAGGDRVPFTIVMPPPNVTNVLHMGHGLNNTVQDVLVRWRRMAGDETLWVPGTDHAGIATQNVVERQLAAEGKTRFDLGRAAFVARVASWVETTGGVILEQLRSIGASCDWTRTAYTLSPALSRAVREAFVRLYEKGLIYRGHRVIHWCPRCLTALSDEEAEHAEVEGVLYHVRYPLVDGDATGDAITVATTRPETILGDVAVAVHPDDERYRALVGRRVRVPLADVEIPVIADAYVDPAFGTGALKITPAHDANDFDVGARHRLPMPVVMTPEATMAEVADAAGRVPESIRGLTRFEARERIVAMLHERGLLAKAEPHRHSLRRCYRCDTIVEPRLSDQWFVKMQPLAAPALEAVRTGRVRILPERWEAVYVNWLENIRDWNISRQLWWGHRIPVWYCDACASHFASREEPSACPTCGGPVRQDDDVLDTWFSSGLWPFSTLGWPDRIAPDLRAFYPTDVLVTAPEILFFWVARMIMLGYEFMGDAPFHTVYLHGTARDAHGVRMQKSLGNGIDPLDVVNLYGADALRYTVIAGLGVGTDLRLDPADLEQSFAPGRNFVTKLWNIGRFALGQVGDGPVLSLPEVDGARLARADHWILARLDRAIADSDAAIGPARPADGVWEDSQRRVGLRLNEFASSARRFLWDELADWYLEASKTRLASADSADRDVACAVLVHAVDGALRLLHPVVPFVTETLWQRLPSETRDAPFLAAARWPTVRPRDESSVRAAAQFDLVIEAIVAIRRIRAEYAVPPGAEVDVAIAAQGAADQLFRDEAPVLARLARARATIGREAARGGPAAHALLSDGSEVIVHLAGAIDVQKECARLRTEVAKLETQATALAERLTNDAFVARAPADVVQREREKQRDWSARLEQLRAKVAALCGA